MDERERNKKLGLHVEMLSYFLGLNRFKRLLKTPFLIAEDI